MISAAKDMFRNMLPVSETPTDSEVVQFRRVKLVVSFRLTCTS